MASFEEVNSTITEIEILQLLRTYPPDTFTPFDPQRTSNQRALKFDALPYTTLYIYLDTMSNIKVFSSYDMRCITKSELLVYMAGDLASSNLLPALNRVPFPQFVLPGEPLINEGEDEISTLLSAQDIEGDPTNCINSIYGDGIPLTFKKELVNLAFLSQPKQSVTYFNSRPGIHHTAGFTESKSIVINIDPLYIYQCNTSEHGYITLPFCNRQLSEYLDSVLKNLKQEICYNLHTAKDYFFFLHHLIITQGQNNPNLLLEAAYDLGNQITIIISFKENIDRLKKRGFASDLNIKMQKHFSYSDTSKKPLEKTLNVSEPFSKRFMEMQTIELKGENMYITCTKTVTFCKLLIELFFPEQPIQALGDPVLSK